MEENTNANPIVNNPLSSPHNESTPETDTNNQSDPNIKLSPDTPSIPQIKGFDYDLYESSNCFSKLLFLWVYKILKLAKSIKLQPDLFGPLSKSNDSNYYSNYLNYFWEEKHYNASSTNALMKAVMKANQWRLIKVLLLSAIASALQFFIILLLKEYIDYFQSPKLRRFTLLQLGITFIVTQLLYIFLSNHTNFLLVFIGFRAKYELNCFIYSKLLKVSPSSFEDKASHGEIVNFLQVDSNKLSRLVAVSSNLVISPIMIIAYIYLLFDFFGISFFAGLGVIITFFMVNIWIYTIYTKIVNALLKTKDARMKLTTEIFDSIKILKLYNWENEFKERILLSRNEEIAEGKKALINATINITLFWLCPICVGIGTIGVYIYMVDEFSISTMLIGLALFARLQDPVRGLPWSINALIETFISMRRIEKFIRQKEYSDINMIMEDKDAKDYAIKIEHGTFTWGKKPITKEGEEKKEKEKEKSNDDKVNDTNDRIKAEANDISKPLLDDSLRNSSNTNDNIAIAIAIDVPIDGVKKEDYDIVLSDINLEIKQGETVGIIGEVGSGKTSLLQAILNSLILLSKPECDGIHIAGSIGYVSQIPWIQNDTIRNNILFFNEYDEEKYRKVLEVSQLKYDLNNLEAHDLTEIGEKGINLSGGQKVRVSLARVLYTNPDIYLFDDPISALDANIGRKVMDDCIIKYLNGKTRLIATHALYFLKDMDKIIYIDQGRIKWIGTYDEIIHEDFFKSLTRIEKTRKRSLNNRKSLHINEDQDQLKTDENNVNRDDDNNEEIIKEEPMTHNKQIIKKLMQDEDNEIGPVKYDVYIRYCIYMGGICFIITITVIMFFWAVNKCGSDLWLAYWSQPENQDPSDKIYFFSIYSSLGIASAIFIFFRLLMLSLGVLKLSLNIHKDMITQLIKAPINLFHEVISRGQLHNRLSRDLENLQEMMFTVGNLLVSIFSFIGAIAICGVYDYYSLIFLPLLGIIGYFLTCFYLVGKRDLFRLERTSYSPILNTVSETIPGVTSIKAFGGNASYLKKFYQAINDNFKVCLFYYGGEIWFNLQFDLLSFVFITYLIIYTNVFEDISTPQSVGIMFTYSLVLQENLGWVFRGCSNLETEMVSMERCLTYTKIISEKPSEMEIDSELKKEHWPQKGKIEFRDYSVKYRPNTEVVLKNLSCVINPGEKIGVIGRTGSGKSTICLCLFRILEPLTGTIYIDDIDITTIGLDLLRQNITIIPQDPTLMQGTLKYNIDPFDKRSNKEILSILRQIGFNIEDSEDSLNKEIEEKGSNLSVGEKQLVCIARAMLRKTRIVVMDEATANIDMKTEEKIQNALKMLMDNSTILTIAHRIKTIVNYDKIIVLNDGQVVEYDSPQNLLENKQSLFYELYSKSAI